MFTILLIVLLIMALGGFGHTGYRRGWYGGNGSFDGQARGGWHGGGLGLILLILVLFLLFGHNHYGY